MLVLGIESSCDETAAALVEDGRRVLSNVVASQIKTHSRFGGVVPELASREHVRNIGYVVRKAFDDAGKDYQDVDGIAVTQGPGLVGSLLVGVSFAKAMAFALRKPLVPVNHIEGHIYSAFIENQEIRFPLLSLVVSGGHTSLVFSPEKDSYTCVSRTRDDAAGEALDKLSKFLGLGYPGGPIIDRLSTRGNARRFHFSIPKISDGRLDFSFSGFKTAALRHIQAERIQPVRRGKAPDEKILDLVSSYQRMIVETLLLQTRRAVKRHRPASLVVVGGVACNRLIRKTFTEAFADRSSAPMQDQWDQSTPKVYYPSPALTTDNAAMIAAAGTPKLLTPLPARLDLNAHPDLELC